MKIDNDCVRDILFTIEEETTFEKGCIMIGAAGNYQKLKKYKEPGKILYHVRYLAMKGLIYLPDKKIPNTYDLTPDGHEFLSNIREDNNWNKIKGISSNIGFASLKIVSAIAEGVATAAINQQLGFSK
ncbi:MAG: DUF2513 domain-containing protein [Lachnospiraceae bacterium]|nr:DUF2513 domain-containing protein [Lachnospiraceae bacterium]